MKSEQQSEIRERYCGTCGLPYSDSSYFCPNNHSGMIVLITKTQADAVHATWCRKILGS